MPQFLTLRHVLLSTIAILPFTVAPGELQTGFLTHPTLAQTASPQRIEADRWFTQGEQQLAKKEFEPALQSFQQALRLYRQLGDLMAEGNTLKNLGTVYYWLEDYDRALTHFQRALAIAKALPDPDLQARVLNNMGLVYWWKGDPLTAIDLLQQSLALAEKNQNTPVIRYALSNLVVYTHERKDYARSIQYAEQLLPLLSHENDRATRSTVLRHLAYSYLQVGQVESAIQRYEELLTLNRQLQNRHQEAATLQMLSLLYRDRQDYDRAIKAATNSLEIARELKNLWLEGAVLDSLGTIYREQGQVQLAERYFKQALTAARQLRQSDDPEQREAGISLEKFALSGLIRLFMVVSYQPDRAILYHQQDLAVAQELGDRQREAKNLRDLGGIYQAEQEYLKAIAQFEASLKLAREVQDLFLEFQSLRDIGLTYFSLGNFPQAISYQKEALQAVQQLIAQAPTSSTQVDRQQAITQKYYREQEMIIQNSLGNLYLFSGQPDQAISTLEQALVLARSLSFRDGESLALSSLGIAHLFNAEFNLAIDRLQQALKLAASSAQATDSNIWDRGSYGSLLGMSARAYAITGQFEIALEQARQAFEIAKADNNFTGLESSTLGFVQFMAGQLAEAEVSMRQAIVSFEQVRARLANNDDYKISLFDLQMEPYHLLPRILVEQGKVLEALEVSEQGRARAFVDLLARRFASPEAALTIAPPNLQQIKQVARSHQATIVQYMVQNDPRFLSTQRERAIKLYIWIIAPTGEITFRQVDLDSTGLPLSDRVDQGRKDALRGRNSNSTSIPQVNNNQNTRTQPRGLNIGFNQDPSNQIAQTITIPRQQYQDLQKLHQLLIDPIQDVLPSDPEARVIFIPHQSLFLVPFVALQDGQGKFLIEKHTILTAPSIQVLQLTQQAAARNVTRPAEAVLIVGNPTMPEGWSPLPGAGEEAKALAAFFKVSFLTSNQATEEAVLQRLATSRIIHLATHGEANDQQPLESRLVFAPAENSDGYLTAGELFDQFGPGSGRSLQAELVVLSACETGLGKLTGDGVIGLSRSFFAAGAPTVVVSLWGAGDESTKILMQLFYRNWQEKKLDKAQAMRQAMLTVLQGGSYPEPAYWAAFMVMGEAE